MIEELTLNLSRYININKTIASLDRIVKENLREKILEPLFVQKTTIKEEIFDVVHQTNNEFIDSMSCFTLKEITALIEIVGDLSVRSPNGNTFLSEATLLY